MNTNAATLEAAHSHVGPRLDYRPSAATAVIFIGLLGIGLIYTAYSLMRDVSAAGVPTANAVATVIYTHSLSPHVAVLWSGLFNFGRRCRPWRYRTCATTCTSPRKPFDCC